MCSECWRCAWQFVAPLFLCSLLHSPITYAESTWQRQKRLLCSSHKEDGWGKYKEIYKRDYDTIPQLVLGI